jgi:uncharacterized protein YjiS (DUF1127 family)
MTTTNEFNPLLPRGHAFDCGLNRTSAGRTFHRALATAVARLVHAIEAEMAARRAMRELAQMSEYGLRDLGLSRGDFDRMVRHDRF